MAREAAGSSAIMVGVGPEVVNPVPIEAIPAWMSSMATTFLDVVSDDGQFDRRVAMLRRAWQPERAWGVRDRERWVGTLRTETRTLTVPGLGAGTREVTIDALTNVTVAATHRRRGFMGQMLGASLRAAHERGDALSALIAAEWPIYAGFGYAPAAAAADYVLRRSRVGARLAGDPMRVRQVEVDEFADAAPALFAAARAQRAGQINRDLEWWNRLFGRDGFQPSPELPANWFVHEGDHGADGLLAWTPGGTFELMPPLGEVAVWTLTTSSHEAYRDLWAYLAGIDGIDEVRVPLRPVDEPVRWMLTDGRALVATRIVDLLWIRLLDVPAALTARRYAVPGEIVLEVIDADGDGFTAGRYALRADGDEVRCESTTARADLEITQRTLASIYLGGFRLHELMPAGGASELRPGAAAQLDVMFSTPLAPWNATWF